MDCCRGNDNDSQFDARVARRELKRFRKHGPRPATKRMLDAIDEAALPPGSTLLDIGGGIGAIHHWLLARGFAEATHIDASSAFIASASEESDRLGHTGRVAFRHGDFHALAAEAPLVDVVTLDRVVCCDPDYDSMLTEAAVHARRLVAMSYPRARWYIRVVLAAANGFLRLSGRTFRAYVHPPDAMAAVLERNGLRRRFESGTFVWAVTVFER